MKTKILSMMDTTKKKVGAVVLCGALMATIGAGTVFAANPITSLKVKMENGVRSYSTDDGKTWSQKAPDGVSVSDKDGKVTITNGAIPKIADGKNVMVKMENGVKSFSTDGGKNWSQKVPDGFKDIITEDGKFPMLNVAPPKDGSLKSVHIKEGNGNEKSLIIKEENGVKNYSTDEGKTWSQKAPEGVTENDNDMVNFK
jgi:hypothetical protein